jgi:hypothetical protein
MKKNYIPLVCAAALCAAGVARAVPPTQGKVLVLDNERTLEGDIERVGTQYRIRRSVGETWVPGERVLALCSSVEEAYGILRSRTNLHDPDEHLRLAQWCRLHYLPVQALAEVREAVRLRPDHADSRRLLNHLQQVAATDATTPQKTGPVPSAEPGPLPPIDLTEEAIGLFAVRVQPILMNACAGCHATGRGGAFKLTRTYASEGLNRRSTQYNLAAVLAQVSPAQPLASPLLTKAVSVHGDLNQSPLKNRQAAAYRALEDWVHRTVVDNPQVARDAVVPVSAPGPEARPVPSTPVKPELPRGAGSSPPTRAEPQRPPATEETPPDPLDPAVFNRQAFPDRGKKPSEPRPPAP